MSFCNIIYNLTYSQEIISELFKNVITQLLGYTVM